MNEAIIESITLTVHRERALCEACRAAGADGSSSWQWRRRQRQRRRRQQGSSTYELKSHPSPCSGAQCLTTRHPPTRAQRVRYRANHVLCGILQRPPGIKQGQRRARRQAQQQHLVQADVACRGGEVAREGGKGWATHLRPQRGWKQGGRPPH